MTNMESILKKVNKERLVEEFIELAGIDSPSFNERQIADTIIKKVTAMRKIMAIAKGMSVEVGMEVYEDKGAQVYGGNTGNLYFTLKGNSSARPVLLMAHMDTVVPCENKKIIVEGDIIKSDGSTILGADDVAGIVQILEALRILVEQNIKHGDIEVVFTFGEEKSLCGAKVLEFDRIKSKIGIVIDNHGVGRVAISGPAQYQIEVIFKGKSAHAGVEPEKGLNAIVVAAKAISQMKLGRLDFETTANVGIITGGVATNIVCDSCVVEFEARSRSMDKLEVQVAHMKSVIESAANQVGTEVEIKQEFLYPSFNISEDDEFIKIFKKGCEKAGIEPILEATGGGSDTNIISAKGIKAIDISCGMTDVHTLNETIKISDLIKGTELLVSIIETIYEVGVGEN